ncbi:hypothetical protein SAMD00019534_105180 [Acytostelium subglobosum LB1]|uniref:hypothetical protein n=1 Tax=Acytostelium subglobosum LB1 TaxID=1410327 RepID=UPI00064499A3|nr:hypothetical protein SAMD00019534_105180 [Acytostelium subglobosum LB1]GAM27343.1 hypothetical protein SAMD00019534_105180 [Acytostelium subglobosum LB1]|eukprot:XP_012749810.1 hypothetical protein SAMD00019534_105180 [Acytostelium subglobosum LB1]
MEQDNDWLQLIDMLLGKSEFLYLNIDSIYSDAIKYRRLDVAYRLEGLSLNHTGPRIEDPSRALNTALGMVVGQGAINEDLVVRVLRNNPKHLFKAIKMNALEKLQPGTQDLLLRTVRDGQLIFDMDPLGISADSINLLTVHEHQRDDRLSERMMLQAVILGDAEMLYSPWLDYREVFLTACKTGQPVEVIRSLRQMTKLDIAPIIQDCLVHLLNHTKTMDLILDHSFDQCIEAIDYILSTTEHTQRVDKSILGHFNSSDVLRFCGQTKSKPIDVSVIGSRLIRFIWSKITQQQRRDSMFINSLLSSEAASNSFTFYRIVLEGLLEDNHFQTPFINVPTIPEVTRNIQSYRRYSDIRSIIRLFHPFSFNPNLIKLTDKPKLI